MKLSPAAFQLILDHEVGGGEPYYNLKLSRPTWPGGKSGVTIGIGYDLGYTPRSRFREDWKDLPVKQLQELEMTLAVTGLPAERYALSVRHIKIPWAMASVVFQARTIPLWISWTVTAFPGSEKLPADAFGALVSLCGNRGPALHGKNRQDMLDIHNILADGIQEGDLKLIALQLREMKPIWQRTGQAGLVRRREDEARLVERSGR